MEKKNIHNLSDCSVEKAGFKLVCYACHGMYYDLNKPDPICPYCQSLYSKTVKQRKNSANMSDRLIEIEADAETDAEAVFDETDLDDSL